jgi:hypothetical protein
MTENQVNPVMHSFVTRLSGTEIPVLIPCPETKPDAEASDQIIATQA